MAEIKTIKEIRPERICELANNAVTVFGKSVRPIYGLTSCGNPEPDHVGSCIALTLGGSRYLLTAAHVIDLNKKNTLYVGTGEELHELSMEFHVTLPPNGKRDSDHFDFAIGRLSDRDFPALDNIRFIPESQIDQSVGEQPSCVCYTAIGYPNSKNKKINKRRKSVLSKLITCTGVAKKNADVFQETNISSTTHVMFSWNAKYARDDSGRKISPVNLKGMSGGAVVDIGNISDPKVIAGCSNPIPLLSGVFIEFKDRRFIVATRLNTILNTMKIKFP